MRPLLTVTLGAAVLVFAGCGSQSRVQVGPAPRLPRAVADSLATRSEALAAALRRGDACAAKVQAHGLERQTRLAIAAGRVPAAYRGRITTAVERLVGRMPPCVLPPPPPARPPAEDRRKKPKEPKPKKHGGKHGKGEKD